MKQPEHKDLFSAQSGLYAAFRPTYPTDLYEFIFQHLREKKAAWDCATGNGQVAISLAGHFEKVFATDISQQQLNLAKPKHNIFYTLSPAEQTPFQDNQFDLTTVGQALHWFDRTLFFEEVKRVSKPDGLLAVWGYALMRIEPAIDRIITDFYNNTIGPYWDEARKLVEEEYRTIEFPFEEIQSPGFTIQVGWTVDQLSGYLSSWSATQKYISTNGVNPVPELIDNIAKQWKAKQPKTISFPVFLRLFRIG